MSRFGFSNSRRGVMSVEFGLIGTTLLIAIFGCIELGRYVATRTALRAAVSEVVRGVSTDASLANSTAAKAYALARTAILNGANLTMNASRTEPTNTAAGSVTVSASYTFTFAVPVFRTGPLTLTATVTSPI